MGGGFFVLGDARAGEVQRTERARGDFVTGFGGEAVPVGGFGVIGRPLAAFCIQVSDANRRVDVAGQRGAPQPGLGLVEVGRDAIAGHQRGAPSRLRGGEAFFRRLPEQLDGERRIGRRPDPSLDQNREQIDRSRQLGCGGAAQVFDVPGRAAVRRRVRPVLSPSRRPPRVAPT